MFPVSDHLRELLENHYSGVTRFSFAIALTDTAYTTEETVWPVTIDLTRNKLPNSNALTKHKTYCKSQNELVYGKSFVYLPDFSQ